uniref:Sushi domain-containing protein n=1 Tax=Chelydra serpentina TaxID=8475 RepID=A0A8C3STW6_CHESE
MYFVLYICSKLSFKVKLCDYPHIENGRLTGYYKNHREKDFPVRLGVTIFYRCLDGYVSKSERTWNLIRCTADGWDPMPKCLSKFLILWQKYYKEGDEISYVCDHEYIPEYQHAKVTCTKNNWTPTPRCIFNSKQTEVPHGYFYETKNRFDLNEKATYRCQIGYTTPEGNETGEIQCLEEGWSPFPECISE